MESAPQAHRKDFENLVNVAHEEALVDNAILDAEAEATKSRIEQEYALDMKYDSFEPAFEGRPNDVESLVFPELVGRPLTEVIDYVKEKYADFDPADISYRDYLTREVNGGWHAWPVEDKTKRYLFLGHTDQEAGQTEILVGYWEDRGEPMNIQHQPSDHITDPLMIKAWYEGYDKNKEEIEENHNRYLRNHKRYEWKTKEIDIRNDFRKNDCVVLIRK